MADQMRLHWNKQSLSKTLWFAHRPPDATISGGVTDPSGNFILNADVEIANDATGVPLAPSVSQGSSVELPAGASSQATH
jgi:hypothetical protein